MGANKLYLALMLKEAGDGQHGRRLAPQLAALSQIGEQMERLIADLVDAVAIEAGVLTVVTRSYPAVELLATATAVFEPLARERGQTLLLTPAPAGVLVVVDTARAIQVIGNLVSNAIKFTPPGGRGRPRFGSVHFQATGGSPERAALGREQRRGRRGVPFFAPALCPLKTWHA
jgi:signal transduction histidine kinase